jgi:hypothetical protein
VAPVVDGLRRRAAVTTGTSPPGFAMRARIVVVYEAPVDVVVDLCRLRSGWPRWSQLDQQK